MAIPSGNAMVPEKMHKEGGSGDGEVMQQQGRGQRWWHHYWQQTYLHQMDERDGFISWLRGEFAAANAIIDALCHHLRVVGEPWEYDGVIGCIQQRRSHWNTILHMQHYFSVNDVLYALQQATWRKQQQKAFEGSGKTGNKYRRGGSGTGAQRGDGSKEGKEADQPVVSFRCSNVNDKENLDSGEVKVGKREMTEESGKEEKENNNSECMANEKQDLTASPKTFVGTEIFDGKAFNVVDGMKLYEELLDSSEVLKLTTFVNELRAAGRRGEFQGQTFVVFKRPMKGHGREMIQFGLPSADAPPEGEAAAGTSKDQKIDLIPGLFQDVIERLMAMQVVTMKPDSCTIDIFNEGDHSQPHMWPHRFARPVLVLFLTECEMTFGKVITVDHPGDYRGSFKLSLTPGSLLVLQGRSTDFAKHAIPSIQKQRILVTFTKSQQKGMTAGDAQQFSLLVGAAPSHWVPPRSRSSNPIRHPVSPKHYVPAPTTGVLLPPTARPQLPPDGIHPIFIAAPMVSAMPFSNQVTLPPTSIGWPAAPPRTTPPCSPVLGTGVFLPSPSSSSSSNQSLIATQAIKSSSLETSPPSEKDMTRNLNDNNPSSPKSKVDEKVQHQDCNGNVDGNGHTKVTPKEEQH